MRYLTKKVFVILVLAIFCMWSIGHRFANESLCGAALSKSLDTTIVVGGSIMAIVAFVAAVINSAIVIPAVVIVAILCAGGLALNAAGYSFCTEYVLTPPSPALP